MSRSGHNHILRYRSPGRAAGNSSGVLPVSSGTGSLDRWVLAPFPDSYISQALRHFQDRHLFAFRTRCEVQRRAGQDLPIWEKKSCLPGRQRRPLASRNGHDRHNLCGMNQVRSGAAGVQYPGATSVAVTEFGLQLDSSDAFGGVLWRGN